MPELLSTEKILAHTSATLRQQQLQLLIFNELPSTNDYLLKNAPHFQHAAVACFAEHQTAGRGRPGKTWVSPETANIYMSLLWHFQLTQQALAGLNMVTGVSIVEAIRTVIDVPDLMLKWPNDVYWRDKKLAGILIDIAGETKGISSVVIGIGVNVNMPDTAAQAIHKPWADLATITGQSLSRNQLAGALIEQLSINMNHFQLEGTSYFVSKWASMDYLAGKHITLTTNAVSISGTAQGINDLGQLLLLTDAGTPQIISTGETSVTFP